MLRITPKCQQYEWGKIGRDSLVAQLAESAGGGDWALEENKPYAELWMGTHPSGPATIHDSSGKSPLLLSAWLKEHPETVGIVPAGYRADDLPFMFKVLSINTALSIQAHPDKALAAELHAAFPAVYKDPNHKPEMAIALTKFEGMNGFRPLREISNHLIQIPELAAILGTEVSAEIVDISAAVSGKAGVWRDTQYSSSGMAQVDALTTEQEGLTEKALRLALKALLHAPDALVDQQLQALVARLLALQVLPSHHRQRVLPFLTDMILRLHKQYPGDRGVLFPLLLNTVELSPGEAFYMAANEPHAYISGDIMECMALSDNVVRAGLTPKFKDKDTLEKMLSYKCAQVSYCKLSTLDAFARLYRPPPCAFSEFEVEHIVLDASQKYDLIVHPCASIIIITSYSKAGDADDMARISYGEESIPIPAAGAVFYQAANQAVRFQTGKFSGVVMYRAHINLGV